MDSCPHLENKYKFLQKILVFSASGIWTWVMEVLREEVCTLRAVEPAADLLQEKQKCQKEATKGSCSFATEKQVMVTAMEGDIHH